MNRYLKQMLI